TDPLIDRFLTSMSPSGDLSLLYIGQQLYGVVNVIVDKAMAAPMVPLLAMQAQINDWQLFRRTYRRRLAVVGGLTIAGYLALVVGGELVLSFLIGHGGISAQNVRSLWWIMVALGGFFVSGAMGQISATTFYAMGDTRTPTRMSVVTYSVYVPMKIIAFLRFGLPGLAVVTSIYFMLNLALQILLLERFVLPAHAQRKVT
ncbi:MAG: lipid II flippase MurJ, partial [Pyrinomonadaceae bacterium]